MSESDGFAPGLSRPGALALLEALRADLLSQPSATAVLERWCGLEPLAGGSRLVARLVRGVHKPAGAARRQALAVEATEPVAYRRVRISFGGQLLSEADNWYVPGRLTPRMIGLLDSTDIPFGRVVQALNFSRRTRSAIRLRDPVSPRHPVLEHRAVLHTGEGVPFAALVETYTGEVLAIRAARDAAGDGG